MGKYHVDGREMYQLSNGLYITANPKYISFSPTNVPNTGSSDTQNKTTAKPTHNLNMRTGPGTNNGIILTIPKGKEVVVNSASAGWSNVTYNGKTGYVSDKFLGSFQTVETPSAPQIPSTPSTSQIYTTTHNLNLRKGASTGNGIILTIPKGSQVHMISSSNGWAKVDYQGKIGYVSTSYIVKSSTPPATTPSKPSASTETGKTTENLNLRAGASTSNKVILTIPKGKEVTIHQTSNGWSHVTYNGKTGYVSHKYLTVIQAPEPTEPPVTPPKPVEPEKPVVPAPEEEKVQGIKKTTGNLYMRVGPDKAEKAILILPKGTEVEFIKNVNDWSKIIYEGKVGYASNTFLTEVLVSSPSQPVDPKPVEPVTPQEPSGPEVNVNLPSVLTINGVTNNQKVPSAQTTIYGDALHGMGVKLVEVVVNGKAKGEASFGGATNNPNNYKNYPNFNKSGYSFTLNPNDLNTSGMNTVKVILTGNNGTKYSQSVVLKGNNTGNYYEEKYENSRDYYAKKEASNLAADSRNFSMYDIQDAIDPGSYIHDANNKYLFMDLRFDQSLNCTAAELNKILTGKGVLDGQGQAFMDAAILYNVNPFYLITHAIHETGHGTSVLAKGQYVKDTYIKFGDESTIVIDGVPEEDRNKLVYNLFGIGAYNSNPNLWGAQKAYLMKWFSVEEAIKGGAQWISQYYVGAGQNTLYKMRFNLDKNMTHQYATDLYWAEKQAKRIKEQVEKYGTDKLNIKFLYPSFK